MLRKTGRASPRASDNGSYGNQLQQLSTAFTLPPSLLSRWAESGPPLLVDLSRACVRRPQSLKPRHLGPERLLPLAVRQVILWRDKPLGPHRVPKAIPARFCLQGCAVAQKTNLPKLTGQLRLCFLQQLRFSVGT